MKLISVFLVLPFTCAAAAMIVWPVLDQNHTSRLSVRPRNWAEKNLGQWCRNFTVDQHNQCPQASAFHQFDCCGPNETDCCFAIQGWVIVILTIIGACSTITLIFAILLKLNLIYPQSKPPVKPDYYGIRE